MPSPVVMRSLGFLSLCAGDVAFAILRSSAARCSGVIGGRTIAAGAPSSIIALRAALARSSRIWRRASAFGDSLVMGTSQ